MIRPDILSRFDSLRQHQLDGKRSPHKPLLVLAALGRLVANGSSTTPFSSIEGQLSDLVASFGRPATAGRATAAAYPFTRLRADGVWTLSADVPMDLVTPLREKEVVGSFTPDIERALLEDPRLVMRLAHRIAVSQFPPTLAGDVLAESGLDPNWATDISVPQDPEVRRRAASWVRNILLAWDRQCAFCGYDGQLGDAVVGIEAAHIRWFNMNGPDDPDNGLALCSLHHKLFDRGALGLDEEYRVKISSRFTARTEAGRNVYSLAGARLHVRPGTMMPARAYVEWHDSEVFKGA